VTKSKADEGLWLFCQGAIHKKLTGTFNNKQRISNSHNPKQKNISASKTTCSSLRLESQCCPISMTSFFQFGSMTYEKSKI